MYTVLLVVHVIITLAMIIIILLQRSSSDGLSGMGGGGGAGGGLISARGQANLLTRITAILAFLFIANSLALSWLTQQDAPSRSIADKVIAQEALEPQVPAPDAEGAEAKLPASLDDVEVPAVDTKGAVEGALETPQAE